MKVLFYCQHVLGMGHFFRSLALCRAFAPHEVVLVTGGKPVDVNLPKNVREVRLPELMMDQDFGGLHPVDEHISLDRVKETRQKLFWEVYRKERPEVLMVELYPLGRKAFRFELDPVLDGIRDGRLPSALVLCSVRDILVEKPDREKHEKRALMRLNQVFDALLVHADPEVIRLDATFGPVKDIRVPVVYTGYVSPKPKSGSRGAIRDLLGLGESDRLLVVSAGSGSVGAELLYAAVQAVGLLPVSNRIACRVFAGPYMDEELLRKLEKAADPRTEVCRFSADFLSYLAAADLSISMAGYNTCMNILATGVPALVRPFSQNREQMLRAERLVQRGALAILDDPDMASHRLAHRMEEALAKGRTTASAIDLEGAANTVRWVVENVRRRA